ncbi:MAG: dicarboxylate/amino acid:cation symporter [Longimicrobiales bacterium]
MRLSLTARVLVGLAAGLALGMFISALDNRTLLDSVGWISPIGTLWVNALRMTVIPLVVGGIIMGAASARDAQSIGRLGARAITLFFLLLGTAALFTSFAAPPLLRMLAIDDAASSALRSSAAAATSAAPNVAAATQQGFPDLRQWLVDLIPTNPVKAAADGTILPLIFFALAFGLALARITSPARDTVVSFFSGTFDAMLVIVRRVLELAPIGVFALAVPLATRLGITAAGAVLYYIAVCALLCTVVILALYPLTAILARIPVQRFMRGAAPAQAVAFSARSSLAALPAMIDGGEKQLGFDQEITTFFLPLSASMFRLGGAVGIPIGVMFVAALYGMTLDAAQILTVALTSVLLTFSVPGIPGGSIVIMVPVLLAVGLPPEAAGILLGVDTIPDMFRTTTNVSGTMAAATILSERKKRDGPAG